MSIMAVSDALASTLGLVATFGGIGLVITGLVVYIFGLVAAERAENQRQRSTAPQR